MRGRHRAMVSMPVDRLLCFVIWCFHTFDFARIIIFLKIWSSLCSGWLVCVCWYFIEASGFNRNDEERIQALLWMAGLLFPRNEPLMNGCRLMEDETPREFQVDFPIPAEGHSRCQSPCREVFMTFRVRTFWLHFDSVFISYFSPEFWLTFLFAAVQRI